MSVMRNNVLMCSIMHSLCVIQDGDWMNSMHHNVIFGSFTVCFILGLHLSSVVPFTHEFPFQGCIQSSLLGGNRW
jgi:hypothetical protein